MAQPYLVSWEGLPCLPAHSQECGGDNRRGALTQGELDRSSCSFLWGGTGRALPEPKKWPPEGMFLSKLTQTDFMMAPGTNVLKWDLCLTGIQPRTPEEAGPPLVPPSLHRWCCSHHNIHHTDSRLFHTCDRCTLLTSSQLWIEKGSIGRPDFVLYWNHTSISLTKVNI